MPNTLWLNNISTSPFQFPMQNTHDVYTLSHAVTALSRRMGFSQYDASMLSTAVSEIATNSVRYGQAPIATVQQTTNCRGMEVCIEDSGSGIPDIDFAMIDSNSSTENSLGIGLGVAKRCADEFIINKSNASGTSVTLRKFLATPKTWVDAFATSFAVNNLKINSDGYLIKEYDGDKALIALFSGGENEQSAAKSVEIAKEVFNEHYRLELGELLDKAHQSLRQKPSSCGVELIVLRVSADELEFTGIGNLSIYPKQNMAIQSGKLGLSTPIKPIISRIPTPNDFCILMHTAGVHPLDTPEKYHNSNASAYDLSVAMFNEYASENNDATTVVIKGSYHATT